MAIIKCKLCGGNLEIIEGSTTATCEYCGSMQTVPKVDDERKLTLFGRANRLRAACEFDKAAGVYETIVADFPEEAEAYWGLVLCRYGIEYVDDPATGKKIPTCHRSSFDSVMSDSDYEQTLENADPYSRRIYREEAKQIEQLRKDIIAASANEEPYDIFICYKETAPDGQRTLDSVLAQDIYDALTDKGYRVFFARITLEDKLGTEYEPVIFAALHSARIMLAVGTDYEYFNAVWVKNEWGRYLKLMEKDREKHLIPCYKGIDAYDMPPEFAKLQAQDLGKVGATQDLLRGVEKILPRKAETVKETVVVQQAAVPASTDPLLKRAFMFLEDEDWTSANEYCEKVLDMDPECAMAYLGKLMAELKVAKQDELKNCAEPFNGKINYQKALRFGDNTLKATLEGYIGSINTRNEETRKNNIYKVATELINQVGADASKYEEASKLFASVAGWKDADKLKEECTQRAITLKKEEEHEKVKREQASAERMERIGKTMTIFVCVAVILTLFFWALFGEIIPMVKYNDAIVLMESGKYEEAIAAFQELDGYWDSDVKISECYNRIETAELENKYNAAIGLMDAGKYEAAKSAFRELNGYKDSVEKVEQCELILKEKKYSNAVSLMNEGKYEEAISLFTALYGYKDSAERNEQCKTVVNEQKYSQAVSMMASGNYEEAIALLTTLYGYKDSDKKLNQCYYSQAEMFLQSGNKAKAVMAFGKAGDYLDAKTRSFALWEQVADRDTISAGVYHTVGLKADGTVVAVGRNQDGQCNVSGWTDIIAISAGNFHTVGLKADGTLVAVGWNDYDQCDVTGWTDIIAISAGGNHTVGLKADGTVVAEGWNNHNQCNVTGWMDIVAISAGNHHTVGLKADGTVVAVGSNLYGQLNVTGWTDIVAISAGDDHTVGLKADGTLVAVGYSDDGRCNVTGWTDIIAISAGGRHTVGLKADGTVVAVGRNQDGQCDVTGWRNIVAISAGDDHTVGLKADDTVVAVGYNSDGQCDVTGWTDIKLPNK